MPISFQQVADQFRDVPFDYRAEVYAAELIRSGLPQEDLFFKTVSAFRRSVSRDIESLQVDEREDGDSLLVLELNREGLYDMLPEGMFHYGNDPKQKTKTRESVLEEIRLSRQQEGQARVFFSPFENEFLHRRLQLELQERSLNSSGSLASKRDLFGNLFGDSSMLNDQQLLALLHLIPIVYKIRGDLVRTAYCLNLLIGYPVRLQMERRLVKTQSSNGLAPLGAMQLGIDSIAGDYHWSDEAEYLVSVSGIGGQDLESFFPGGANRRMLDYFLPFVMPAAATWKIGLEVTEKNRENTLADSGENEIFLSINSYL
ncbi:MAG: hypothetical protein EOO16_09475 [Chitinophagaceae bacterium]|nr:MAG: hypothetical protein EOO16_09475 [Chitinophagaceae bacterium]